MSILAYRLSGDVAYQSRFLLGFAYSSIGWTFALVERALWNDPPRAAGRCHESDLEVLTLPAIGNHGCLFVELSHSVHHQQGYQCEAGASRMRQLHLGPCTVRDRMRPLSVGMHSTAAEWSSARSASELLSMRDAPCLGNRQPST